jgi:TonB family protein
MSNRLLDICRLRHTQALIASAIIVFAPHTSAAQAGTISGTISDSAGHPIAGAEVIALGTGASVATGDRGEFRISGLRAGSVTVKARRLGFRTDSVTAQIGDAVATIALRLANVASVLKPVVISTNRVEYKGRLAGYYERLDRRNSGYFITRAQIDRENPRTLTQLLQRAPGMSQFRGRGGLSGVRMRGRSCWPLVWLDGTLMSSGEVDLDGIPPSTLHGIELYLGSTTAPMRYTASRDLSSCGTIILWSRGPDTDPLPGRRASVWNIEALVSALEVYTADQVDTHAQLDPSKPVNVEYPASLFAEKTPGSVIAEFVVSADGKVEDDTFGVVSSTDQLFTASVRRALEKAVYTPATLKGKPVRQLVHQPFTFEPGGKPSGGAVARQAK